ncbi:hypothetical protein [Halomarina rubra]|uniref:Uncharacterized protein n=1 Tax=Halomarina rubra TaxID=2071873 RepID=A0ABD6AV00_9EURY|nr:hypothetical protein [Halomarina rubra]
MNRRALLSTVGTGLTLGLSGCASTADPQSTSTNSAQTTSAPSPTETPQLATPGPPEFDIRARDDLTLTVLVTEHDNSEPVYEQTHSLKADDELTLDDALGRQSYDITFSMDGETVWQRGLGICEWIEVSVGSDGSVEIVNSSIC